MGCAHCHKGFQGQTGIFQVMPVSAAMQALIDDLNAKLTTIAQGGGEAADLVKGDLLVVHGSGDDNVHYQGTEKLANALVAEGRDFTLMAYPNRSHSVSEGKGTTRHLYGLMTRYLQEKTPPGPR